VAGKKRGRKDKEPSAAALAKRAAKLAAWKGKKATQKLVSKIMLRVLFLLSHEQPNVDGALREIFFVVSRANLSCPRNIEKETKYLLLQLEKQAASLDKVCKQRLEKLQEDRDTADECSNNFAATLDTLLLIKERAATLGAFGNICVFVYLCMKCSCWRNQLESFFTYQPNLLHFT